eukprot:1290608-Pyramimonas_sp.AAC.1
MRLRQFRSTAAVLLFSVASIATLAAAQSTFTVERVEPTATTDNLVSTFFLDFLDEPESIEWDEDTDQYFTHKGEGDKAGCLSVFTPDNILIAEDFGCCPGAAGMVVRALSSVFIKMSPIWNRGL